MSSQSNTVCDPAAQVCFVQSFSGTEVRYAKLGTGSQSSPTSFVPPLYMAQYGIGAAAGGVLYAAGSQLDTTLTDHFPVLQSAPEDGSAAAATLANFGPNPYNNVSSPVIVTSQRVYFRGITPSASNASGSSTGLMSVPLPNGVGNAAPSFLTGTIMDDGQWLAAWGDDTSFSFANGARQWVTCPPSGCSATPTVLASANQAEPVLTGDAQAIYWIDAISDPTSGAVTGLNLMKVAR